MHRDGNALAINDLLNEQVKLAAVSHERKPDDKVAKALKQVFESTGRATEIGMPHLLATVTIAILKSTVSPWV